jgi:hypothetical protein
MTDNNYCVARPPYVPQPNHVLPLYRVGSQPLFGCAKDCGCAPGVAKIAKQYSVPPEAQSCIDLGSLNTFIDEVNDITEDSYIPPAPMFFTSICIPFCPLCLMWYYTSRGVKKVNALLEKTNPTMRNCHWLA